MNYSKKISVAAILTIAMLSSCIKDKDLSQITNKPETYSEVALSIGGECNTTETPMDQRYRRPAAKQALCLRNI